MSFSWFKYWCEGFVLLTIILIGTAANFFSVIIIRNRELSLVQVQFLNLFILSSNDRCFLVTVEVSAQ
jgi:hypothetical protein